MIRVGGISVVPLPIETISKLAFLTKHTVYPAPHLAGN